MYKYFTASRSRTYIDALPKLVTVYNHAYHRSIKAAPASVNERNAERVWHTLFSAADSAPRPVSYKFSLGDTVRISMAARPFRKGYLPGLATELFTISDRLLRLPPVYRVKDYDGEELDGTFYENELQRVIKSDQLYEAEKVLCRRKRGGKNEYFVKWLGYPDKFNGWVTGLHKL